MSEQIYDLPEFPADDGTVFRPPRPASPSAPAEDYVRLAYALPTVSLPVDEPDAASFDDLAFTEMMSDSTPPIEGILTRRQAKAFLHSTVTDDAEPHPLPGTPHAEAESLFERQPKLAGELHIPLAPERLLPSDPTPEFDLDLDFDFDSAPVLERPIAPAAAPAPAPATAAAADDGEPDTGLIFALREVHRLGGSDLHVTAGSRPMMRLHGTLVPVEGFDRWMPDRIRSALYSILTPAQRETFEEKLELDLAYGISGTGRFRVNVYQQRDSIGAAFRLIATEIKSLDDLGVSDVVSKFAALPRGLVLVTGPTGSGKSTTLAALIDLVNQSRADHIVTVEDPIEYLHSHKKSIVNQREVGHDTHSFSAALKHVLRQDPDVILVGEMRDLETISVALTAAETGHLVFATLHTQSAAQTIDRVIDVYPPHQQNQVRAQLAATLRGVVCQTLVPRAGGAGRAVATEVLIATSAVSNLIREGQTHQIPTAMQAGASFGMHTLDQSLADLVNQGIITQAAAIEKSQDTESLLSLIHRVQSDSAMSNPGVDFGDSFSATTGVTR